jgi:HD-GYP domain-containing protein (c-di-GMP phosphodiesterase class II)/pSer/pThr/pTyr-binding forkhead associated (FHA) protein
MAYVRIKTGPNKGRTFEIKEAPLTIGREDNQLIQILDQGVSRAHAEIFRLGEMCFVRDLNSTNGTFVNDVKVTEELLKNGDELLIGTTILVFVDPAPGAVSGGEGVVYEGEEGAKFETTTVELKVDERDPATGPRPVGREVQSRNLTLISQVGRILRSERTVDRACERALEVVTGAIGASQGYLFLWDEAAGKLAPRAVIEAEDAGAEKKVSRTIVNRVRETVMPLLTSDATLDGRFSLSESIILKKIKSVICVPVLADERVDGLLYFHSSKVDHALSLEDLELASSVALQLSMARSAFGQADRLRRSLMATIRTLASALETVEPAAQGHAQRVSNFGATVAAQMGLSLEDIHRVRLAGLLHDAGKIVIRPGSGPAERAPEEHVRAAERIFTGIEGFEQVMPGIRYHHERADGSGFPYKVKNADTPVLARIVIVANAFDNACSRGGPGEKGMPSKEVIKDMAQRGGKDFDDEVIKALILCHRNGSLYGDTTPAEPPE